MACTCGRIVLGSEATGSRNGRQASEGADGHE